MNWVPSFAPPIEQPSVLPALKSAICSVFSKEDWQDFALSARVDNYVLHHARLLRSLDWGDADYGACVNEALIWMCQHKPDAIMSLLSHAKLRNHLERSIPVVLNQYGLLHGLVLPVPPPPLSALQTVELALVDADQLLATAGAANCIDRLHTALHGYVKQLCTDAGISIGADLSLPKAFSNLRELHPKLAGDDVSGRVLKGMASCVDALNTLRNHSSLAHPNDALLSDAEARLVVNFVRSLFHYLQAKL